MNSQTSVKVEGVCDHAEVERARSRVMTMALEGVDSLKARLFGEDLGEEEGSVGSNCDGWERVETILYSDGLLDFGGECWWKLWDCGGGTLCCDGGAFPMMIS